MIRIAIIRIKWREAVSVSYQNHIWRYGRLKRNLHKVMMLANKVSMNDGDRARARVIDALTSSLDWLITERNRQNTLHYHFQLGSLSAFRFVYSEQLSNNSVTRLPNRQHVFFSFEPIDLIHGWIWIRLHVLATVSISKLNTIIWRNYLH